jgi:hypothetical protein
VRKRAPGLGARATATFRHLDDRSSLNKPTPRNSQDGLADGSDDDRAWFARHHGRSHRIRKAVGSELRMVEPKRGFKPMVAVQQIAPGERIRAPFGWRKGEPLLNSEAVAGRMFRLAAGGGGPRRVIASAWWLEREP